MSTCFFSVPVIERVGGERSLDRLLLGDLDREPRRRGDLFRDRLRDLFLGDLERERERLRLGGDLDGDGERSNRDRPTRDDILCFS